MPWARIRGDLPRWQDYRTEEDRVPEHIREKLRKYQANTRGGDNIITGDPDPRLQAQYLRIPGLLGLTNPYVKVHIQKPGAMVPMHDDRSLAAWEGEDSQLRRIVKKAYKLGTDSVYGRMSNEEQEATLERVFVFLEDHEPGQVIIMDGQVIDGWQRGDVMWFDWRRCEHATCNVGRKIRPLLQITGVRTERWHEIDRNNRLTDLTL